MNELAIILVGLECSQFLLGLFLLPVEVMSNIWAFYLHIWHGNNPPIKVAKSGYGTMGTFAFFTASCSLFKMPLSAKQFQREQGN